MAAIGYWIGSVGEASPVGAAATAAMDSERVAQRAENATPVSPGASADAAGRARYADLVQRAPSDREAAVELAHWLADCASIVDVQRSTAQLRLQLDPDARNGKPLSTTSEQHFVAAIERGETSVAKRHAACRGVSSAQVATRSEWLYRAAKLGDAKSALEFGSGNFLAPDILNQLDEIAFWRDHAEEALDIALEGGEPAAARLLAFAYDPAPQVSEGAARFAPDPERAYAYYSVMSMTAGQGMGGIIGDALERLAQSLDEAQIAEATELAASICTDDFAGLCNGLPSE
jgi:hypothetical protein